MFAGLHDVGLVMNFAPFAPSAFSVRLMLLMWIGRPFDWFGMSRSIEVRPESDSLRTRTGERRKVFWTGVSSTIPSSAGWPSGGTRL